MVQKVSMDVDGLDSSSHIDLSLVEDFVVVSDDSNVVPMIVLTQNVFVVPSSTVDFVNLIIVPLAPLNQNVDANPFFVADSI